MNYTIKFILSCLIMLNTVGCYAAREKKTTMNKKNSPAQLPKQEKKAADLTNSLTSIASADEQSSSLSQKIPAQDIEKESLSNDDILQKLTMINELDTANNESLEKNSLKQFFNNFENFKIFIINNYSKKSFQNICLEFIDQIYPDEALPIIDFGVSQPTIATPREDNSSQTDTTNPTTPEISTSETTTIIDQPQTTPVSEPTTIINQPETTPVNESATPIDESATPMATESTPSYTPSIDFSSQSEPE